MPDSQSWVVSTLGAAVAVAARPAVENSPAADTAAAPLRNPRRSMRRLPSLWCESPEGIEAQRAPGKSQLCPPVPPGAAPGAKGGKGGREGRGAAEDRS
ncbi:hypothetical protein GCM10010246_53130 [Streptomyces cuspidosporus]|uniref:Secreted protein n=1 Tax=Streptomyces cuspidosporus TaxID=66882 RepID=A0ABP5TRD5_9ACTN